MFKFLGIGAQKAGTTWLYEILRQHPDISFPLEKEVHYWNRAYPNFPVQKFLDNFNDPRLTQGEITPAYAFLPLDTIEEISKILPNLKLIYIIRNPIDRAWSSAKMALKRAEMEAGEASDQWFIDHFKSKGSLLRGDYETSIKNWLKYYDRDQLLIVKFEEIIQAPEEVISMCCKHLSIAPFEEAQLRNIPLRKKVFSTENNNINTTLHTFLHSLYKDKINNLEKYLKIDLTEWKS